jgi:hypothetical protein
MIDMPKFMNPVAWSFCIYDVYLYEEVIEIIFFTMKTNWGSHPLALKPEERT